MCIVSLFEDRALAQWNLRDLPFSKRNCSLWQDKQQMLRIGSVGGNVGRAGSSRALAIAAILHWARAILPSGVLTNLPVADVDTDGFTECWRTYYGNLSESYDNVFYSACTDSILMLACRPVGSSTLTVAAWVKRSELMNCQCGTDPASTCLLNGASWYNSDVYSVGYAMGGDTVNRNSCDTNTDNPDKRLCWHTSGGNFDGGCALGPAADSQISQLLHMRRS